MADKVECLSGALYTIPPGWDGCFAEIRVCKAYTEVNCNRLHGQCKNIIPSRNVWGTANDCSGDMDLKSGGASRILGVFDRSEIKSSHPCKQSYKRSAKINTGNIDCLCRLIILFVLYVFQKSRISLFTSACLLAHAICGSKKAICIQGRQNWGSGGGGMPPPQFFCQAKLYVALDLKISTIVFNFEIIHSIY